MYSTVYENPDYYGVDLKVEPYAYVTYAAGPSIVEQDIGVDYMSVVIDGIEYYAEKDPDPENEVGTYEALKKEIIELVEWKGINSTRLKFHFDEEVK